jgi:hypothetical protein
VHAPSPVGVKRDAVHSTSKTPKAQGAPTSSARVVLDAAHGTTETPVDQEPQEARATKRLDLQTVKATALAQINKVTPELVEAVMVLFFTCDDATDEVHLPFNTHSLYPPTTTTTNTHEHTQTHAFLSVTFTQHSQLHPLYSYSPP